MISSSLSFCISAAVMPTIKEEMERTYHIAATDTLISEGRALSELSETLLEGDIVDRPIVILVGRSRIGSVGLAAASHLLEKGAWVQIICLYPIETIHENSKVQLIELQETGAPLAWAEEGWELPPSDLIVDAMSDDFLHDEPGGKAREMILLANSSAAQILSVEVPCGIDTASGRVFSPHIAASATIMFGALNRELLVEPARSQCGNLYLADIGMPAELYAKYGVSPPPEFAAEGFLLIR